MMVMPKSVRTAGSAEMNDALPRAQAVLKLLSKIPGGAGGFNLFP